jgi:hypothetical protein
VPPLATLEKAASTCSTGAGKPARFGPVSANAFCIPDNHIEAFGEMQQRRWLIYFDAVRTEHGVVFDTGPGALQRPRVMVNVIAPDSTVGRHRVKTVSFG